MWIAGQESANKAGRPKGRKRNFKVTIDRFFLHNITLKELQANYEHLKLGKERIDMLKILLPYHVAPMQADALTNDEINELYQKLEQTVRDASAKKAS